MCSAVTPNKWYSGVDPAEVLRYAGIRDLSLCGEDVLATAVKAIEETGQNASPKKIEKECVLTIEEATCWLDDWRVDSQSLAAHLDSCSRALLFAATLGSGVDTLIRRYSAVKMSYAVMLQAAAAAMIEYYCDTSGAVLEQRYAQEGCYLTPRFSPGYGDFSLACQNELTARLNAYKYAGIAVSAGGQMTPMKSVTAVIGITGTRRSNATGTCASGKCAGCSNISCEFRRI